MMRLVLVESGDNGSVLIARLGKRGNGPLSKKILGTHFSYFLRSAARQFGSAESLKRVDFRLGEKVFSVFKTAKQ